MSTSCVDWEGDDIRCNAVFFFHVQISPEGFPPKYTLSHYAFTGKVLNLADSQQANIGAFSPVSSQG